MIPIRDTIPAKKFPIVNTVLIGINILVFLIQLSQGQDWNRFITLYGLIPARFSNPDYAKYFSFQQQLFSTISFMFLHGGFWHILGNMWSLYIFGDNIEDRLGPFRYLFFYLLCGMASGLTHLFANLSSEIPVVGASGAIAGVMGAYFILYPHARILTLIPIIIIPWFIEIPAFFFLGIWLLLQIINAAASQGIGGGIAWWAHIGGFVFGIFFLKLFTAIPATGLSRGLQAFTEKKKTPRLQVIRPVRSDSEPHLYGSVHITPWEALTGTRKILNIPIGFKKRLIRVSVPPGIQEGKILRLKGLGQAWPNGQRGDLFLKVFIRK